MSDATATVTCPKCREAKPATEFGINRHRANGRQDYCRSCKAEFHRNYYRNNTKAWRVRANKRQADGLKFIQTIKEASPCLDCGRFYPAVVMDFDHRDRARKVLAVSQMKGWNRQKVLDEIAKCDLVCANCHRVRTFASKR